MEDKFFEFVFGLLLAFVAMIFAGYPMIKDIINKEPNAIASVIWTILIAAGITIGIGILLILTKKYRFNS